MALFKQIREAANRSPYAIGMAVAKKKAGITAKHAEGLPKSVITKGHEIAKKIKANESYDTVLAELEVELTLESMTAEEIQNFMESAEFDQLDEISKATLGSYVNKAHDQLVKHAATKAVKYTRGDKDSLNFELTTARKEGNRQKGMKTAVAKLTKEDMDLNEAEMSHAQIMKKIKDGTHEAMTDIKPGKHVELRHTGTGVKKMVFVKPASVNKG